MRKISFIICFLFLSIATNSLICAAEQVLKWDASTGEVTGYTIYYGTSQGSYLLNRDVGDVTQYALNNFPLSEGVTYYFVVRSYNSYGESANSGEISYTVPITGDTTPPLPPVGVLGEIVAEQIVLTWQENNEADIFGYRVYYGTSIRNYGLPIPVDGSVYTITGLLPNETYYICVTSVDTAGNESGFSSPEVVKIFLVDVEIPSVLIQSPTIESSYNSETNSFDIGGIASDIVGVTQVIWSNSTGGNGIASGTDNWSVSGIILTEGENIIAITARDEAGNESSDVLTVMYTIPDTTAPVVTIASPTSDPSYNTGSSILDIGGTASDAVGVTQVTWSNSAGTNGTATGTDNWSAAGISLTEGENIITITATDAVGNESTDQLTVTYVIPDTIEPSIVIDSPTTLANYNTDQSSISVGGTASDNQAVAQVTWLNSAGGNGIATGIASWRIDSITLSEGENIIAITARDEAGNESSDVLTVMYTIPDTTAPVVTIASPTSDPSYNTGSSILDIGGTASDAVGVTQVTWSNSAGTNGTATGTDNWSAAGISLTEGENIITITATDAVGNESTDQLTVTYVIPDTIEPAIVISSPTSDASYNTKVGNITLSGTASDNKAVAHVTWTNSAGGNGIASGTESWSIAGLGLTEGENIIAVTARDEAGNESSDSITIQYSAQTIDTTLPVISVNSPTTGRYLFTRSASVSLSGNASDNIGIKEILWNNSKGGDGKASGTSDWRVSDIALAKYWNAITITAIDFSSNKSVHTLYVFSWY